MFSNRCAARWSRASSARPGSTTRAWSRRWARCRASGSCRPDRLALAYADALVPVAPGRALNPPMALGRLLTEARLGGGERALVIGAATGYSAAVLARLVASVVALEEDDELAAFAKKALAGSGVALVKGPLAKGHAKGGAL